MADFDDERQTDPQEWMLADDPRPDAPAACNGSSAGESSRTRSSTTGPWWAAAWLLLVTATAMLVAGIIIGHGLLIATGLVLAGIAGHLFTPEFSQNRNSRPPTR